MNNHPERRQRPLPPVNPDTGLQPRRLPPAPILHELPDRGQLAHSLAAVVAEALQLRVAESGKAVLAVSGGSTPDLFLQALSQRALPWSEILVSLVDERCVDESHVRSNAGFVRRNLLQQRAAEARFVPLYADGGIAPTAAAVAGLIDVAVLGMGTDGHSASWFPDARELEDALDPANSSPLLLMEAPSAGEPRISCSLSAIVRAPFVMLHIEGAAKRELLRKAATSDADDASRRWPVRALLDQRRSALPVFWCP
jgi:6-phosphogluconolactonase